MSEQARWHPKAKVALSTVVLLSLPGILLAAYNVYDSTWLQWSAEFSWTNLGTGLVHSGWLFPAFLVAAFGNLLFVPVAGGWWLWHVKARTPGFPHKTVAAWLAALLAGPLSFLVSSSDYAALAVLALGPGHKSLEFQQRAASTDSVLLLDALQFRGVQLDDRLMCVAAQNRNDSPRVIEYLASRGLPVNVVCGGSSTPLRNARSAKKLHTAQALIKAGANAGEGDGQ